MEWALISGSISHQAKVHLALPQHYCPQAPAQRPPALDKSWRTLTGPSSSGVTAGDTQLRWVGGQWSVRVCALAKCTKCGLTLISCLQPGTVVGSVQSWRRGVSRPLGAVGHRGRESAASWGRCAEAGLAPAGGAGELEERRGSPLSAASVAAPPQAAAGVGAQSAGSALQLLTCCGAGDVIHAHLSVCLSVVLAVSLFLIISIWVSFHSSVSL